MYAIDDYLTVWTGSFDGFCFGILVVLGRAA